jgi:hypothetical protein
LYDEIAHQNPNVEYLNEIPPNLGSDDCINPQVRNLVILDDLMTKAAKNAQVTDLFCEGSHHRNLSVIALNQNFYFGKDPTQRRNTQYLVLFKNPIDQMPIQMLSRQMYPSNSGYFMQQFSKATHHPYGHLIVDLKTHTHAQNRLKANIFGMDEAMKNGYSNQHIHDSCTVQTGLLHAGQEPIHPNHQSQPVKGYSCDECGVLFNNLHDLQQHIRKWCPVNDDDDDDDDVPMSPVKRLSTPASMIQSLNDPINPQWQNGYSSQSDDKPVNIPPPGIPARYYFQSDNEEPVQKKARNDAVDFDILLTEAWEANDDDFQKLKTRFKRKGYSSARARAQAHQKMRGADVKTFFDLYKQIIVHILTLYKSAVHKTIVDTALSMMKLGISPDTAAKETIKKNKDLIDLDGWFHDKQSSDNESKESESDETEGDETEEDETEEDEHEEDETEGGETDEDETKGDETEEDETTGDETEGD